MSQCLSHRLLIVLFTLSCLYKQLLLSPLILNVCSPFLRLQIYVQKVTLPCHLEGMMCFFDVFHHGLSCKALFCSTLGLNERCQDLLHMRVIYCNLKGNIQISSLKSPSYHTGSWGAQFLHRSFLLAKAFCYTRIPLVQPSWAWVFPQLKIQKDAKSFWWLHGLRDTFGFNMQIWLKVSWCNMSWRYMCRKRRSSFLQLRAPNLTVVPL